MLTFKIPTLSHFNAKFNLEWQGNTYDKLISAIPLEWRILIQSNTSITFIQYQQLLYTTKSIKEATTFLNIVLINNTLFGHKMQSINGTETCTQMTLTLNRKEYAPKYVTLFL